VPLQSTDLWRRLGPQDLNCGKLVVRGGRGGAAVVDGINAFPTPGAATGVGLQNAGATLQGLDTLRRMAAQMGQNGQNPAAGRLGGLVQGNIEGE
jgi:hypothetical protein